MTNSLKIEIDGKEVLKPEGNPKELYLIKRKFERDKTKFKLVDPKHYDMKQYKTDQKFGKVKNIEIKEFCELLSNILEDDGDE